jgi:hypothetical protein
MAQQRHQETHISRCETVARRFGEQTHLEALVIDFGIEIEAGKMRHRG